MNCLICLNEITSVFTILSCECKNVIYHPECIENWLKVSLKCPICNKNFKTNPKSINFKSIQKNPQLDRALFLDSIGRYPSINTFI